MTLTCFQRQLLTDQRKQDLRHDIMNAVKANNLEADGLWLTLFFCTESELKTIARELHVKVA